MEFLNKLNNVKIILSTGALIIATLVGGYNIVTNIFVTKSYAKELESKFEKSMEDLRIQTLTNSRMIIEMQMIRLENKMARGEKLTPTEKRQYELLKEKLK